MKTSFLKKFLAVFLAIAIFVTGLPIASLAADLSTAGVDSAYGGTDNKISDPATVNDWKLFFGPDVYDTSYVGGVWTDKSVFNNVADYINATDEAEGTDFGLKLNDKNNFLVALSAIASSKSVEGYSTLPSDTILVLDLSASMTTNQAVSAMVQSANNAIEKLLELNAYNRVGVVAYSGNSQSGYSNTNTATVILPLGRYNKGVNGVYLDSSWRNNNQNRSGVKVANGVTGTIAAGVTSTFSTNNSKQVSGGTYIQNGLYKAYEMFNQVTETYITSGPQAGTKRVPVTVLLSDGAPTTATTSYTNIGTSNSGNGTNTYATAGTAFMTQLTASWVRDKVETKYGTNGLFYTLGLNVGSNDSAKSVLDPSNNTNTDSYWSTFKGLTDDGSFEDENDDDIDDDLQMSVAISGESSRTITYTAPVSATKGWSEDYVTEYFPASNAAGLISAFSDIVQQIIIQSLYYPTLVETGNSINHDGFLEFDDYIGKNMEVKAVKGIQLGTTLYDGSTLAKMIYQGGMGTVENPTDAGNNLVWAVQDRLGIDDVQTARTLIGEAYSTGQLYYNPINGEYSNYIGWYADANGKFIDFWDGVDASPDAVPEEIKDKAVYANKSYGYYDAVGEGHRKTDMMYATILVRTTLKSEATGKTDASEVGDVRLIGKLPASLIPLVEYDIELEGTDPEKPSAMTITGATAPSRLIYEVGLSSKIDVLDIESTAPDALVKDTDGNYVFYTNQWNADTVNNYSYSTNKNTISFFEPSIENERYYYNADTLIYTDEHGTLYTGDTAPVYDEDDPYYHRSLIYTKSGNTVTAKYFYEQISKYVLDRGLENLARQTDGSWVIKRGTIHHYFGDYIMYKTSDPHDLTSTDRNATETLNVSDMPFVHEPDVGVGGAKANYHVDSYLGNNGRLTINPYEGVKITKTADATILDREQSYEFYISANVNAELTLVIEGTDGNRTFSSIGFNGEYTVNLKSGEAAYLLGAELIGKAVTVKEIIPDGAEYAVYSINGDTNVEQAVITVAESQIADAAFVNTIPKTGDVVITKNVVSAVAHHNNKEFSFTVTLSGQNLDAEYTAVYSKGTTATIKSTQANTVTLKQGESIDIKDLPEGTVVNVTEADYSGVGFTVNQEVQSMEVVSGETKYLNFTNTYSSDDTDPANITVTVNKALLDENGSAADWNGRFEFQLQQWVNDAYTNVGAPVGIDYTKGGANTTVIELLKDEVYTEAGDYYYRVVEVVNNENVAKGIVYDTTYCRFYVTVTDNGEGKLVVSSINNLSDTTVNGTNVTASFNNTYVVSGAAEAIIDINKVVKNAYNQVASVLPAGFSFSLYEADSNYNVTSNTAVATSPATGAAGTARISVLYSTADTHYYVLKEDSGNIDNVTYTNKTFNVKVVVDDVNGYYTITVTIYDGKTQVSTDTAVANANNVIAVAEVNGITFENTYTPEEVELTPNLAGNKNLTGRGIRPNEFSFSLYETGADFTVAAGQSAKSTAFAAVSGAFSFDKLSYDREDTHYYVIKENIPNGAVNNKFNGVTYDTTEYHLTVVVTGDATTGQLTVTSTMTKNGNDATAIVFDNSYTVEGTTAKITGNKHLAGNIRKLQAGAYQFELVENGEVIQTVSNGTPTGDYDAGFEFNLSYDKTGDHTYIVREVIPDDAVNYKHHGVVYDAREYTVIVNVTDDGNGNLVAAVNYNGATVAFTNTYEVEPTDISFSGTKFLKGDEISKYVDAYSFKFELYTAVWSTQHNATIEDKLIATVGNDASGRFEFKNLDELKFDAIGAYRFIIKEVVPANADELMDYDGSVYYIEVDVIDNLQGKLETGVNITKVNEMGETSTESEVVFNNLYNKEPIKVDINGTKSYNTALADGQFTFELYQALLDAEGKVNPVGDAVLEAKNDENGSFKFEEVLLTDELSGTQVMTNYMTFTKAGIYYFVVKEKLPEGVTADNNTLDRITYDTNSYVVKITVSESVDSTGREILVADREVNDVKDATITITNIYTPKPENITVNITAQKTVKNVGEYAIGPEGFEFVLEDTDNNGKLKVESNDEGLVVFELTFTENDIGKEYSYKLYETNDGRENVEYSTAQYEITVAIELNDNNELVATVTKDGKEVDEAVAEFENIYEVPKPEPVPEDPEEPTPEIPESPKTGDSTNLTLLIALLFISGGILIGTVVFGKRKKV